MMIARLQAAVLAVVFALAASPGTMAADALSPEQKKAVEGVIRDYLLTNPEVIIEAIEVLRERERSAEDEKRAATLAKRGAELRNSPGAPVAGNPKGDVSVVEFFDYNCGYCKRVLPTMRALLKSDPNVRYVFKELPILSSGSEAAARAALAAWRISPKKYMVFHAALMETRGSIDGDRAMEVAASVGLDEKALKAAMDDPAVEEELALNRDLASDLGITGTPAFVVGDQVAPGAVNAKTLRHMIEVARDRK